MKVWAAGEVGEGQIWAHRRRRPWRTRWPEPTEQPRGALLPDRRVHQRLQDALSCSGLSSSQEHQRRSWTKQIPTVSQRVCVFIYNIYI